jgi:hypothetical protein
MPDFLSPCFALSMGRLKPGAHMSRTGQSEPSRLRPQAMSLDEARQVIARWLESIQTVDPIDLTEERFDAAIASDQRLNEVFDIIAASAVEQFSAHVVHGRLRLARRLTMSMPIHLGQTFNDSLGQTVIPDGCFSIGISGGPKTLVYDSRGP